jgi:branched-subunit amino acid permease
MQSIPRSWPIVGGLVILAILLVIVGVLYQTGDLQLAASTDGKHVKHAAVAYACAVLCLVGANFARPRDTPA